jgi:glycosyltransferase involved in cell wall biosynthesis
MSARPLEDVRGTLGSAPDRVAVIIPVYRARFLAEALDSVFAQSHPPDEVIVVDDGSPDVEELEGAVGRQRSRITLLRQSNMGAAAGRNRGIATTTAPLVALLDADDRWLPDFLAEQLAVLRQAPDIDVVYSDGIIVGDTRLAGQTFMMSCPSVGEVSLESLLAQRCTVLCSAGVARRRAILDAGGFDVNLQRGQDFDMWLRMACRGARFAYQRKVLVERRIHDDNLSGSPVNEQERPLNILEKAVRTLTLTDRERWIAEKRMRELRASLAREHGKEFLLRGQFADARREFARAQGTVSSWKLRATLVGLHLAPRLVRRVFLNHSRGLRRPKRTGFRVTHRFAGAGRDR